MPGPLAAPFGYTSFAAGSSAPLAAPGPLAALLCSSSLAAGSPAPLAAPGPLAAPPCSTSFAAGSSAPYAAPWLASETLAAAPCSNSVLAGPTAPRVGPEPLAAPLPVAGNSVRIYFSLVQEHRFGQRTRLDLPLSSTVREFLYAATHAEGPLPPGAPTFEGGSLTDQGRSLEPYGLSDGCPIGQAPWLALL